MTADQTGHGIYCQRNRSPFMFNLPTIMKASSTAYWVPSGVCVYCGADIAYKAPDAPFLGGWVGNDGWGTLCPALASEPEHRHDSTGVWVPFTRAHVMAPAVPLVSFA